MSNRQLPELASKVIRVTNLLRDPEYWTVGPQGWYGKNDVFCLEGAMARIEGVNIAPHDYALWAAHSKFYRLVQEAAFERSKAHGSVVPDLPLHDYNDLCGHSGVMAILADALQLALRDTSGGCKLSKTVPAI